MQDTASQIATFFGAKNFENSRRFLSGTYTPQNLQNFLKRLPSPSPQKNYHTFHIAGTVGKGSSAFFLAVNLKKLYPEKTKIGLYTSPHLQSIHERFQINRTAISETELASIWQELRQQMQNSSTSDNLSYFDALTAIAFLYFAKQKVEAAVIECGLGGRMDSTNIIEPLFSVITPIALDHQNILGNSIEEIAREKAGIFKTQSRAYSFPQKAQALAVLQKEAKNKGIHLLLPPPSVHTAYQYYMEKGDFMQANHHIITFICDDFFQRPLIVPAKKQSVFDELAATDKTGKLIGRMEKLARTPPVWFDSAHNQEAIEVLVKRLLAQQGEHTPLFLCFNFMRERDFASLTSPLLALVERRSCHFFLFELTPKQTEKIHTKLYRYRDLAPSCIEKLSLQKMPPLTVVRKQALAEQSSLFFFGSMRLYALVKDEFQ